MASVIFVSFPSCPSPRLSPEQTCLLQAVAEPCFCWSWNVHSSVSQGNDIASLCYERSCFHIPVTCSATGEQKYVRQQMCPVLFCYPIFWKSFLFENLGQRRHDFETCSSEFLNLISSLALQSLPLSHGIYYFRGRAEPSQEQRRQRSVFKFQIMLLKLISETIVSKSPGIHLQYLRLLKEKLETSL